MPKIEYTASLTEQQKQSLLDIWNTEYPKQLCMPGITEFDDYLNSLTNPAYLLLITDDGETIGWATLFTVEAARCFFIMLKSKAHGSGYGTQLLNALKEKESVLFGWAVDHGRDIKADGTPYPSPINFYRKNGFNINNDLRLETDILSAVNIIWQAETNL